MNTTKLKSVFESRNISFYSVPTVQKATQLILSMIPNGSSVGYGGSETLEQIGILDKIRQGNYLLFDRSKVVSFTPQAHQLGHLAQHANYFLSSSNAVTTDGKIVNVDRTGNRVSALIYGPEHVIVVVGKNKIVANLEEALTRIKTIAAPKNAQKKQTATPCTVDGICHNCNSPDRLCCNTVIIARQHQKDRMTLIIVDQDLGF